MSRKKGASLSPEVAERFDAVAYEPNPVKAFLKFLRLYIPIWLPELITTIVVFELVPLVDSTVASRLASTAQFGTIGGINNMMHFFQKLAQAVPVAAATVIGLKNGNGEHDEMVRFFRTAVKVSLVIGLLQFALVAVSAGNIIGILGMPENSTTTRALLAIRSASISLLFIYNTMNWYLRARMQQRWPMVSSILGAAIFILLVPVLSFGFGPFKGIGVFGPAVAALLKESIITAVSSYFVAKDIKSLGVSPKRDSVKETAKITFSIAKRATPIAIGKSTVTVAYVMANRSLTLSVGAIGAATFEIVKHLARMVLVTCYSSSAAGAAITSNAAGRYGEREWGRFAVMAAAAGVFFSLPMAFMMYFRGSVFASLFHASGKVMANVVDSLKILVPLMLTDGFHAALAGAMRGGGFVTGTMLARATSFAVVILPGVTFLTPALAGQLPNPVPAYIPLFASTTFVSITLSWIALRRFGQKPVLSAKKKFDAKATLLTPAAATSLNGTTRAATESESNILGNVSEGEVREATQR